MGPSRARRLVECSGIRKGCATQVHVACYGDQRRGLPKQKLWYCDCCKHNVGSRVLQCALCLRTDVGNGMRLLDGHWQHMLCRHHKVDKDGVPHGTCSFCWSDDGFKLPCWAAGCGAHAHPVCALLGTGFFDSDVLRDEETRKNHTRYFLYCRAHSAVKALVDANHRACSDKMHWHQSASLISYDTALVTEIQRLWDDATEAIPRGVRNSATYTAEERRQLAADGTALERWFMMPPQTLEDTYAGLATAAAAGGGVPMPASARGGAATASSSSSASNASSASSAGPGGAWLPCTVIRSNPKTKWSTLRYPTLGNVEECVYLLRDASPLWVKLASVPAVVGAANAASGSSASSPSSSSSASSSTASNAADLSAAAAASF